MITIPFYCFIYDRSHTKVRKNTSVPSNVAAAQATQTDVLTWLKEDIRVEVGFQGFKREMMMELVLFLLLNKLVQ
jgi:hypothetical protein